MRQLYKRIITLTLLVSVAVSSIAQEKVTYIHHDGLGNPVVGTDENGDIEWQIEHYPYGAEYSNTEVRRKSDIGFAGKAYDEEIGLSYFGGRWYDPDLGRFVSIDPVGVNAEDWRTFNRYSYGFNNPYKYIDPDGNLPIAIPLIAAGLLTQTNKANAPTPSTVVTSDSVDPFSFIPGGGSAKAGVVGLGIVGKKKLGKKLPTPTKHSVNQKINRSVKTSDELDALKNPLKRTNVRIDSQGRPSEKFIGQKASVAVNPKNNKIVTVHPTGSKFAERLKRQNKSND